MAKKRTEFMRGGIKYWQYRDTKTGRFAGKMVRVGRSLGKNVRKRAKKKVKAGYGDRGDQARKR